jgi:hypothetical protein
VALFVLIIVGVVVAQTWIDWRDSNKSWVFPDWAKGIALGGTVGVLIAAAGSFASVWLRDSAAQWTGGVGSGIFWLELGFLLAMMGIIVLATRRKRLRIVLLVACALAAVLFLSLAL